MQQHATHVMQAQMAVTIQNAALLYRMYILPVILHFEGGAANTEPVLRSQFDKVISNRNMQAQ